MYSIALGPRCFKSKMLSLSGLNSLLFPKALDCSHTRSAVNICVISKDFLFVSLVTDRVSHEEMCLPCFDVLKLFG